VETQLAIHRVDSRNSWGIYRILLEKTPEYLKRCSLESPVELDVWARGEPVFWVPLDCGGLIVTDWRPRLSLRIHPVVWGKKLACDRGYIEDVLSSLSRQCIVKRIEVMLPLEAPDGLFRWCTRARLHFEGVASCATQWFGEVTDGAVYAYTEAQNEFRRI